MFFSNLGPPGSVGGLPGWHRAVLGKEGQLILAGQMLDLCAEELKLLQLRRGTLRPVGKLAVLFSDQPQALGWGRWFHFTPDSFHTNLKAKELARGTIRGLKLGPVYSLHSVPLHPLPETCG